MKCISRMMTALLAAALLIVMTAASAFAAESGVDWSDQKITVQGMGVAPANARTAAQARMLARRAAVVDGYRQIAEIVKGVNVSGETTVENMMVTNDVVKTKVSALVQGARVVSEEATSDGGYIVNMEVSMFGVSDSLASAVLEKPAQQESFPEPVASVAPSTPATKPATHGSSAASAPSGQAIGGYTGLIVDCRGLGLKPAMSPVIKNANGQAIYGYKNLDYDKVVSGGMAGYTTDMSRATRAGSNPLVVKAVSLDNGANPVLSVADANRVLIENGATGFLDATNVVFIR